MRKINACVWITVTLLIGCTPQRFFFYPNKTLYIDPDRVGLYPELVEYPSLNGKKLYGLLFKTDQKPMGLVVHFHGNYGNVSNHFPLALFLVKKGFDVLAFDYEGYGASQGKPSFKNLVEDGIASVRFAASRHRGSSSRIGVFGQSLGGSIAVIVAAREPLVKAAVIEAAFTGQRDMSRAALKRHVWTWPLYPIYPLFLSRTYDAIRYVAQIAPRPVMFVHGDNDTIVPVEMSKQLYAAAREPKKLWVVADAGHLEIHRKASAAYEETIARFFKMALSEPLPR